MLNQTLRVLGYMKEYGSITPLEAFRDLGCFRLGARIWDLKREGYRIETDTVEIKNRWGQPTRFARYRLAKEATQTQMAI